MRIALQKNSNTFWKSQSVPPSSKRVAFHPPTCTLDPFLPLSRIWLPLPLLSSISSLHRRRPLFVPCWQICSTLPNLKILPLTLFSPGLSSRTTSRAHKKQPISTSLHFRLQYSLLVPCLGISSLEIVKPTCYSISKTDRQKYTKLL